MAPARKPTPSPYPMKAAGLSAVAAGVSGSPPPTLGTLMEVAATFDDLFRNHYHFRRFRTPAPEKKPRAPRAGAKPPKRPPRPKPVPSVAFLATRIDLAAAPPVTVCGPGFVAELWPKGVLDVFSNEPVEAAATLTANTAEAIRHRFELTAISAGVVTLTCGPNRAEAVEADIFASRLLASHWGEPWPVEKVVGKLLIKGAFGWTGEVRQFSHPQAANKTTWPTLEWERKELLDLTPAVREGPLLLLLANPAG